MNIKEQLAAMAQKYQIGGISGIPIYSDINDFYNQHKNIKRKGSNFITKDSYGNISCGVDDNGKYNCIARANQTVDALMNNSSYFEPTEKVKKLLGVNSSTLHAPSQEEISNNIHYKGDTEYGSFDSWDIMPAYEKNAKDNIIYKSDGKTRLTMNDYMEKYSNKVPVGSYITMGGQHFIEGEEDAKPSHTVRLVGYDTKGEPLIADYGKIIPMRYASYMTNPETSIYGITSIPGKEKYTYDYFKNLSAQYNSENNIKYIDNFDNLPLNSGSKKEYVKASNDYIKFHDDLVANKNKISSLVGISSDDYDRYAKTVLAISGQETKYGTSPIYDYLDGLKKSKGVTSLRLNNLQNYNRVFENIGDDLKPTVGALLYARDLHKQLSYANENVQNTIDEGGVSMRKFTRKDETPEINMIRGHQQQGYLNRDYSRRDTFDDGEISIKLPRRMFKSKDRYSDEVNELLSKESNGENYKFGYDSKGRKYITKSTTGNSIDPTLENLIMYGWQSPASIVGGDAHGDSAYYKNNVANYNDLFNKKQTGGLVEDCNCKEGSIHHKLHVLSNKYKVQYAQMGTVIRDGFTTESDGRQSYINSQGVKQYTDSPEYQDLYSRGLLYTENERGESLPQGSVNPEVARYLELKSQYPFEQYMKDSYFSGNNEIIARGLGQTVDKFWEVDQSYKKNYDDRLNKEYVSDFFARNPQNDGEERGAYLDRVTKDLDPSISKFINSNLNPEQQTTYWQDAGLGLNYLLDDSDNLNKAINSNSNLSSYEREQRLSELDQSPNLSRLSGALETLGPLSIPAKLVQSTYRDGYSAFDALQGRKNNAGIAEDMLTDTVAFSSLGALKQLRNLGRSTSVGLNRNAIFNLKTNNSKFIKNNELIDDFKPQIEKMMAREKEYITSPEYMKLRMENTGESESKVKKSIEKILKNAEKVYFTYSSNMNGADGAYLDPLTAMLSADNGIFPDFKYRPKIQINPNNYQEGILGSLDHEIKHLFSPIYSGFNAKSINTYRNYPKLEMEIANKDMKTYMELPFEQQVRFNKLKDIIQENLGIKRGTPLTADDLPKLEEMPIMKHYNNDVTHMLHSAKETPGFMLDGFNKAWSTIPIGGAIVGAASMDEYQSGGQIPYSQKSYSESDIKDFYSKMINSKWYRNRLVQNDYDRQFEKGVDKIIKGRANRVNKTYVGNIQKSDGLANQLYRFITSGERILPGSGSYYNGDSGEITLVKSQLDKTGSHPRTVLSHEFGHAETQGGLSDVELEMLTPDPESEMTHNNDPYERKSDINSIRYNLYKNGLYNPETGRYKTKDGKFNATMFDTINTDKALDRTRKAYGDQRLIDLMNTVASNQNIENVEYAQSGGLLKSKLQEISKRLQTQQMR